MHTYISKYDYDIYNVNIDPADATSNSEDGPSFSNITAEGSHADPEGVATEEPSERKRVEE